MVDGSTTPATPEATVVGGFMTTVTFDALAGLAIAETPTAGPASRWTAGGGTARACRIAKPRRRSPDLTRRGLWRREDNRTVLRATTHHWMVRWSAVGRPAGIGMAAHLGH